MTLPRFDQCLRPLLAAMAEVPQLRASEGVERVAKHFQLTEAQCALRVPSGVQSVIANRVGWARTDLGKAGLIERVSHGTWRITAEGRAALARFPREITPADLRTFPAFRDWIAEIVERAREKRGGKEQEDSSAAEVESLEPGANPERMAEDERRLRAIVEAELLDRMLAMPWARFELLVEQLVVKLGYGSSADEVASALRGGADEGIDGVIKEDRLGLGQIYLQAKRWQNTVGRPVIQSFVGAMHGKVQKGVFITTSAFSAEAREYAVSLQGIRLRLVDGRELASLMVDCGLGVSEERVYRTYRIDSDFFEEGE